MRVNFYLGLGLGLKQSSNVHGVNQMLTAGNIAQVLATNDQHAYCSLSK